MLIVSQSGNKILDAKGLIISKVIIEGNLWPQYHSLCYSPKIEPAGYALETTNGWKVAHYKTLEAAKNAQREATEMAENGRTVRLDRIYTDLPKVAEDDFWPIR